MLPKPELAYFVIADISGYTSFLAGVELDHAQDIIADLMDTVVKGLRPPFRLAKFEGDAAFVYAVTAKVDGSMLQDTIESAYFKFRRRLRDIKQASACECKACAAMGDLDFKFVSHHGEMVKQKMGGREELAGRDVILVHRLLKNTVSEKIGSRAYALYSEPASRRWASTRRRKDSSSITKPSTSLATLSSGCATSKRHGRRRTRKHASKSRGRTLTRSFEFDIAAPRQAVWEYLTVPGQWQKWWPTDEIIEHSGNRRRGVGTKNHCMHGKDAIIEELLDWRPFDYFTVSTLLPMPGAPKVVMTRAVQERPNGTTHLEMRIAKPKPKDTAFVDQIAPKFKEDVTKAIESLRRILEGQTSIAVIDEPPLKPSNEQFLTEPVK